MNVHFSCFCGYVRYVVIMANWNRACYGASGFAVELDYVKCSLCQMFSMGKEQELLDAARSGNVALIEKILSQKNKWNLPLLPQQLTAK